MSSSLTRGVIIWSTTCVSVWSRWLRRGPVNAKETSLAPAPPPEGTTRRLCVSSAIRLPVFHSMLLLHLSYSPHRPLICPTLPSLSSPILCRSPPSGWNVVLHFSFCGLCSTDVFVGDLYDDAVQVKCSVHVKGNGDVNVSGDVLNQLAHQCVVVFHECIQPLVWDIIHFTSGFKRVLIS